MKRRFLCIVSIILAFKSPAFSQQISFTPANLQPEKSIFVFLGITQDHLGYIWLSSRNSGIYRFDGTELLNYSHTDTISNSLASDWAECIFADSSDMIWIGTFGRGLDRFDPATNTFTHFRHIPGNNSSIANDTVTAILEDHLGNLWIGNSGGLDLLDRKTKTFTHYSSNENDAASLSCNQIRSIYEDRSGTLWIGTGSPFPRDGREDAGGLNRFNRSTGNFTRYMHDPANPNSLATNKVKALFEDSKGNFWVGTSGDGLHIMDRDKGTFTHYYYDPAHPENLSRPPPSRIPYDHITFINEDVTGSIWIGSMVCGLNRYDPVSKKTTHFGLVAETENTLNPKLDTAAGFIDATTWQALFSKDGLIWITTYNSPIGNFLYNASLSRKTAPFYQISKHGANSFYYDSDSILWIGTDEGLIRRDQRLHTEKFYPLEPKNKNNKKPGTLSQNLSSAAAITVVRMDKNKNIWLGTFDGIYKLDPRTNIFTSYKSDLKNNSSLVNNVIWSMCMDHNDDLWIGTAKGLDKMDLQNGRFTHISHSNLYYCIREDHNNNIWAASNAGVQRINGGTGSITEILNHALAKSLCVDFKNNIWIGADTSRSGNQLLYHFDRARNQFVQFLDKNMGNHITNVFDILEDDKKNLWVSTSNAIFKINEGRDTILKYGENYGVHPNAFGTGDNFKARNGLLFFGDVKGYYSFFPEDLKGNSKPILNFTSFKLNDKEVFPSENDILKSPIWLTKEIWLPYNQNSFSLDFVGINYQSQSEAKYVYMLENYDITWHKYSSDHRAYYFNVAPGKYIFHVKAFSPDGGWSEKSISFIISPPWWKTWWAYSIFALLFVGTLWGIIYYRSKKLRKENRLLEHKVAQRTNELNHSLEELKSTQNQLIQSEKMASLGELTAGIAHEIQNPLNFVNNFSEVNAELITEMKEEIARGNFEEVKTLADNIEDNERKIIHHGKRADAIVKGMLQHSRTSTGQKEPTDLNALADEYLRLSFHGLRAKDKSINAAMKTDFDPAVGKISLMPQDIGRVLLNLYNNAFYSVTEKKMLQLKGFEPVIFVSTKRLGNKVEIRIRDNGMGVPKKILDKIFQPFFTTKPTGSGTGLGLSLSYDIIKSHGGELKLESSEGEGAEFIILLPVV